MNLKQISFKNSLCGSNKSTLAFLANKILSTSIGESLSAYLRSTKFTSKSINIGSIWQREKSNDLLFIYFIWEAGLFCLITKKISDKSLLFFFPSFLAKITIELSLSSLILVSCSIASKHLAGIYNFECALL